MNLPLKLLLGLLGIALGVLILIWLVNAGAEYILCLLRHWFGYHLNTSRQVVSDACISHLNPFNLFP